MSGEHILAVEGLTKDFPPVRALSGVSLQFARGEVHGIIGENGAGKSTLMKVLAGLYRPTSGRVVLDGREVAIRSPLHAAQLGIAMVHQELNLIDELTVAENIFLGREPRRFGLLQRRRMRADAAELLAAVGCDVSPSARARTLSIAQQQMVEIARALGQRARVLILDEPTAVLTQRETLRLFELISRLKSQGATVLYISHILPDVLRICDRITIMRDGKVVRTLATGEAGQGPSAERLLGSLMVGRELGDYFPPRPLCGGRVRLRLHDIRSGPRVRGVSLSVLEGEIFGLAGLIGAGRTELAEAVCGLRRRDGGQIFISGHEVDISSPAVAVDNGLAYLSEDRRGKGLVMGRSVADNATLAALDRCTRAGLVSGRRQRAAARDDAARLGIRVRSVGDAIETLSGGNQQKVALAKWLRTNPKVLLLDEPTRGIDVAAKAEIYRLITDLARQGMACLLISSELNELLGLCHRIAVMRGGRLAAVLEGAEMTESNVMFHAAGVKGAQAS
jgi:ribose transport system ATP-binding protein